MATQQSVDFHFSLLQCVLYTSRVCDQAASVLNSKAEVGQHQDDLDLDTLQLMRTANSPLFKLHGAMPQKVLIFIVALLSSIRYYIHWEHTYMHKCI